MRPMAIFVLAVALAVVALVGLAVLVLALALKGFPDFSANTEFRLLAMK